MTLQGKGFFTLDLPDYEGDPAGMVAAAQAAGLSHVIVKIADGAKEFNGDSSQNTTTAAVVQALRAAGIAVWGWHLIYGKDPVAEANMAIQRTQSLGLDGYVICAGSAYKETGKGTSARRFMATVREALSVPIALSSFRFPNYHPEFPWSSFLEKCDYHMPQVFWEQARNAAEQLLESKRQCDALPHTRPYIPTGPSYVINGWQPTPVEISQFLALTHELGIPAVNFFEWDACQKSLPEVWTTIAEFAWPVASPQAASSKPEQTAAPEPEPEPEPAAATQTGTPNPSASMVAAPTKADVAESPQPRSDSPADIFSKQFLTALNSHKAGQISMLYSEAAVRVWGDQTVHGPISIRAAYAIFFSGLPAGTTFSLLQVKGDEDLLLIRWQANTTVGKSTLFLQDGKIILDYTFLEQSANETPRQKRS